MSPVPTPRSPASPRPPTHPNHRSPRNPKQINPFFDPPPQGVRRGAADVDFQHDVRVVQDTPPGSHSRSPTRLRRWAPPRGFAPPTGRSRWTRPNARGSPARDDERAQQAVLAHYAGAAGDRRRGDAAGVRRPRPRGPRRPGGMRRRARGPVHRGIARRRDRRPSTTPREVQVDVRSHRGAEGGGGAGEPARRGDGARPAGAARQRRHARPLRLVRRRRRRER